MGELDLVEFKSTPLDPSLLIDAREIVSRIIIGTTVPYEWKEKPLKITLDEETEKRVLSRWQEYGFAEPYRRLCIKIETG